MNFDDGEQTWWDKIPEADRALVAIMIAIFGFCAFVCLLAAVFA